MIWFGGLCMVPRAFRSRERTMTMRVKDVSKMRMAGARERTVISRKICKTAETFPGLPASSRPNTY